jgi:sodium/proline symporter
LFGILARTIYGSLDIFVKDREMVFPYMVMQHTPPFIAGILLAGVLAAVMSTVCSQLVVASSAVAEDFYINVLKKEKKFDEKVKLRISRLSTTGVGILGLFLVFYAKEYVYTIVSWGWAGLSSVYAPIITLIFFWKRLSKAGVFASFIFGLTSTILWVVLGFDEKIITVRLISFPISFISAIAFSLLLPDKKEKAICK